MFGSIHLCLKQQIVPSCLIAATVTEVHTAHSSSESSWVAANRTSHLICARPRRGGECYSRASSDVEVTSSRHVGTLTLATTHELSRGLLIPSRRCAQSSQGAFVCRNRLLIRPDSGKEKFQGYFLRPSEVSPNCPGRSRPRGQDVRRRSSPRGWPWSQARPPGHGDL